jgi:hypothetical protein
MGIAQNIIDSIDWSQHELIDRSASGFGTVLSEFIADASIGKRASLWATVENHVFSQDDIFSAAEPTLRVLFAALVDGVDAPTRHSILDLVFHIVQAASYRDDELGAQCMADAAAASWLLVREALVGDAGVVEACVEVLGVVDPNYAALIHEALR